MSNTTNFYTYQRYNEIFNCRQFSGHVRIVDHLEGFLPAMKNPILDHIQHHSLGTVSISTEYLFENQIIEHYPNLKFYWKDTWVNNSFQHYNTHPTINFKNFICSFNGSHHVSRRLLVAILQKFGYFNPTHCSKNFSYTTDILDGHILDLVDTQNRFYRKFFISDDSEEFFQKIYSFGHARFNHAKNIFNLETKLTESFIHIASESMATSYYPYVTEKFLYSVITRGLFLAYAHPGWHEQVEKYYGFKKYTKLFDYRFDAIQNPVERLVELMCMISKFSTLSTDEWRDLYLLEQDTIEYNYNHYFSGDYLKHLPVYDQ